MNLPITIKVPPLDVRAFIALALIAGFMAAYFRDKTPDQMMKGALMAAFAVAYGYYLGSSKGSNDKTAALMAPPPALPDQPDPQNGASPGRDG